jgi:hypothetical protein
VPEKAKEKMTFKFVEKVDEMLPLIFETAKQTKEIKEQELSTVH